MIGIAALAGCSADGEAPESSSVEPAAISSTAPESTAAAAVEEDVLAPGELVGFEGLEGTVGPTNTDVTALVTAARPDVMLPDGYVWIEVPVTVTNTGAAPAFADTFLPVLLAADGSSHGAFNDVGVLRVFLENPTVLDGYAVQLAPGESGSFLHYLPVPAAGIDGAVIGIAWSTMNPDVELPDFDRFSLS